VAVINLISDKGIHSPEVSIMKLKLKLLFPDSLISDLTHEISSLDFLQAARVLKYFYTDYPSNTIHLCLVDAEYQLHKKWLVAHHQHSYIIAPDNGLLPAMGIDVSEIKEPQNISLTKNVFTDFTEIAQQLLNPNYFDQIPAIESVVKYDHETVSYKDSTLKGIIVYIDRQGNLITDISQEIFEKFREGRRFRIIVTRHDRHEKIEKNYSDVGLEQKEIVCRFNRLNRLEIALNRENASQLLGLKYGKWVMIEFY
ncbi:MAG: SAM-dependent chlorinase/fluorinase, partial [Bacteroidetes bacterium]|nr:SAM-dependent chlorinase/fluorinase [Bacteroidota bacterium]